MFLITVFPLPGCVPASTWLFNNRTHVLLPPPPQLIFHECRLWRRALRRFMVIAAGNCYPLTSTRGMSDVLHIKLCAGYQPTNSAMAYGRLAVIPVKPQLSALIHHDAFHWFGAFAAEQVLRVKGTAAIERKYFFAVRLLRLLLIQSPASECRAASAGLNWRCRDVRVWDSGRVLALHYSQQLGLSL